MEKWSRNGNTLVKKGVFAEEGLFASLHGVYFTPRVLKIENQIFHNYFQPFVNDSLENNSFVRIEQF